MSDFYCAAPWRGLHINSRGDVKTCCAGNPNMLGNLNTNGIEQILNGSELADIRRTLSQGQAHAYCANCVNSERFGNHSERAWHNNKNFDIDYATAGESYHWPTIVDVRWNNTCNLSCNYCGPLDSSRWASLKNITVNTATRHYYDDVCKFLAEHHSHIKEVALVGGEPFLLKENIRLLDVIPDDCIVTLITNLSNPLKDNEIFLKLAQRRKVGWSISFDNIGERFEYVRHGAIWTLLMENLALVKALMVKPSNKEQEHLAHWGGIHAVYNIYNATRITELRQFAHDQGLTVLWQTLSIPPYLDPTRHGAAVAQLALQEIQKFLNTGLATEHEVRFFSQLADKYQKNSHADSDQDQAFKQHIIDIETKYHPDKKDKFVELWPELEFLCK